MNNKLSYFAEIVESSLQSWKVQCWHNGQSPPFGALVASDADDCVLYGVVYQVDTGSDDPVRITHAYQKTEEELKKEQHQIFEFLKTTFLSAVLGYKKDWQIYQSFAPSPAKIHVFVRLADQNEYRDFFKKHHYLHILFAQANQLGNTDELLLAILSNLYKIDQLDENIINDFIETFLLLNGNDYRRLKLFLQRLEI